VEGQPDAAGGIGELGGLRDDAPGQQVVQFALI